MSEPIVHSQSGIAYNKNHVHERRTMMLWELMLISEGELYIRHLEDYRLVKNDFFFLPAGIEHYGTSPTDCTLHWHHLFLPPDTQIVEGKELPQNPPADMLVLPIQFNLPHAESAFFLSRQLEQYDWKDEDSQTVRNALITAVIGEIALEYKKSFKRIGHKRLNSILSYIDNNFQHHPVTMKLLAEQFGYNEKYIYNLFKKYLGISPLKYIIGQKLKDARQMVLNSSETVEAIALSLHYENPQYFMRQFKNYYGMTPTEMRRHYANSLELHLKMDED